MSHFYSQNFSGDILCDEALLRRYSKVKPIVTIDDEDYLLYDLSLDKIKNYKDILFSNTKQKQVEYKPYDRRKYSWMLKNTCIAIVKGFCPQEVSVASILSQLPDELLDKITAFKLNYNVNLMGNDEYLAKVRKSGSVIVSVHLYREKIHLNLLSDEKLSKLNDRIIPIIEKDGKKYTCKKKYSLTDIKQTSYIWADEDFTKEVDVSNLKILSHVKMLHKYSYPGFFKPSIAEVLSQIPEKFLNDTVAFEIIDTYQMCGDAFDDGYHTSSVRLYGRR